MARTTESQVKLTANGEQAVSTLGELQSQVKTLSKELRQLTPDTEAFNNKVKELASAQNKLQDIKEEAQRVRQQMRNLGDDAKNARADLLSMSPFGNQLKGFADGFGSLKGAIGTNIQAFGALRVAIVATGIGALVLAVLALASWFVKTDEGAKMLEGTLNALGNVVDVLMNRLRMLLTGDFEGAFSDITAEMEGAVKAGYELAEVMDQIDERQRELSLLNAQDSVRLAQLLQQSKNKQMSDAARLELLRQAAAIEEQTHARNMEMAQDQLKAIDMEIAQMEKSGTVSDDVLNKRRDAQVKIFALQEDSISLQEKINNRMSALEEELKTERIKKAEETKKAKEKIAAERLKLEEDALKKELELARRITDLQVLNIQDEGERKRSTILLQYKRQIEDAFNQGILTKELEMELLIQRDNALNALEADLEAKKKADKEKKAADRAAEKQQELAFEIEAQIVAQENARTSELERDQAIYLIRRNGMETRLALLAEEGKRESLEYRKQQLEIQKLDNEHAKKQVDIAQKTYDTEEKLQRAKVDMFVGVASDIKNTLAADENNRRRFAGIIKAMTIAEIVGNGIKEVQAIWMNANSNPINAIAPGWAQAFAGVQTAFAAFRTGTAIANVSGLQLFEKGGVLFPHGGILTDGQRHSSGGIKLVDGKNGRLLGEVERGEALHVYSRQTVENNRPIIDALLDTSMFRNGAPITGRRGIYENGGVVPVGTRNGEGGATAEVTAQASAALLEEMRGVRQAVEAFPTRIRAVVTYEQMKAVADEASQIEQEAAA